MKRNKGFLYLVLAILCVWCPLFMGAWDKDKPSASTSLRSSNPEILANWSALETSFGAHHEFSTGGTNSGDNLRIKFNAPISTPTNAANKLFIYGKDVGGVIELHILDESGNEIQLTSGGNLFSSTGLTVTGASTFNGSITLGAGDDLIGSATSDITINTNKFTVAGATGNTVIAGTASIGGTLGVTGVATLGDTSALATSGAPAADAQIANKKYVDDQITAALAASVTVGATTTVDDDEATMLAAHAYLCNQDGMVEVIITFTTGENNVVIGYDDTDTNPAAGGDIRQHFDSGTYGGNGSKRGFSFLMASGRYFEITVSQATVAIRWVPFGTLIKCTDQD